MFNLNEYMRDNRLENGNVRRIKCTDGFTISVQGSNGSYCDPREDLADHYYEVECGFPNATPEYIMDYAENEDDPTETVYGYVPVELVEKLIDLHGGV